MNRTRRLTINTVLLTSASLVMRTIGMAFQVWLVGRIGEAGIGLYQLVMSVTMLLATLAVSGIRFAATRLVAEELGHGRPGAVSQAMRRCLIYSLCFGIPAALIMYFMAEPIGFLWVGDARTVLPLRILSLSLPFISLSSVMNGYFTACGRVHKSAAVQISEQLLRVGLVALFLGMAPAGDMESSCAAVALGAAAAEVFSFALLSAVYIHDRRGHGESGRTAPRLTARMLNIALPLAFSAYARTALSTLEHLLVPRGLKSSGLTADDSLAGYGVIQGMVFPIVFFPSAFLMAVSELLVPEMTRAQVEGNTAYISGMSGKLMRLGLIFALGAAGVMFTFANELGMAVYSSQQAGKYIRIFSFLAPVMYLDMVMDGMLKGLGQQLYSMGVNIIDASISVLLIWKILPQYALMGYVAIICFTECFNAVLSFRRLIMVTRLRFRAAWALIPAMCAAVSGLMTKMLAGNVEGKLQTAVAACLMLLIYAVLIRFSRQTEAKDTVDA